MYRPFYFIRHGETDWNKQQKLQGHSDIPLNELGRRQAETLKDFVTDLGTDITVFSSDLKRAAETARIAAPHLVTAFDPRLREVHLGEAEGSFRYELEKNFGSAIVKSWFSSDEESLKARFPGGESRREAIDRALSLLLEKKPEMRDRHHVFFAHGLLMRSVAELAFPPSESPRPQLRAKNCSVFEFEWRGDLPVLRQVLYPCDI